MNLPAWKGDRLVCGCWSGADHIPDCALGAAETIAGEALETAAADTHPITAALIALTEAGILRPNKPVDDEQLHNIVMGLLDDLYEVGLLAVRPDPIKELSTKE